MERQYSFSKQIHNDYSTLLSFIGFIMSALFVIGIVVFNFIDNMQLVLGIIFGVLSLLCLLL